MFLVPTHYADLVLGPAWRSDPQWHELAQSGVDLGLGRVEIDVAGVGGAKGVALRTAFAEYATASRRMAGALEHGNPVAPWVIVERPLLIAVQQAGSRSAQRGDLEDELAGLREFPDTGRAVDALLGAEVATAELQLLSAVFTPGEGTRSTATLRIEGRREWGQALGGTPSANELERIFTLEANHATWRDRAVRRLVRVEVTVTEILPDPADFPLHPA